VIVLNTDPRAAPGAPVLAPATAPAAPPLAPALEFDLPPAYAARLLRCPPVAARRQGRARAEKRHIVWHDTPAGALAKQGRAVATHNQAWRLELLGPGGTVWLPATPAPILARAARLADLPGLPAEDLVPVAAFTGISRSLTLVHAGMPARLEVLDGQIRHVTAEQPCCRVTLCGDPATLAALALEIAAHAPLTIPAASLAATALAFARGKPCPPRHLGAPDLAPGLNVAASLTLITGHLADVILHWAARVRPGAGQEPVHQMRVALRRLRSALSVFRRAAPGEAPQALGRALKDVAALLGAARDWDVFLDGSGAAVGHAFPRDKRVAAMLAAARRRQTEAYAALTAYLASPAWRMLALRLALLPSARAWVDAAAPAPATLLAARPDALAAKSDMLAAKSDMLAAPAAVFAAQALQRRWKQLRARGEDFDMLPPEALHALRKDAKRLRYAAEFFAPLFPTKPTRRFLERLVTLQATLGAVNDSHVAAALMARLGGADRAFAAGVVQGYVAASSASLADGASKAWRKLVQQDCFWA